MSTLFVNNLSTASGTNITLASGKQLDATAGTFVPPAGHIVQIVTHRHGDLPQHNSTSFVELSSNYRATITPKYANSKILINATININPTCATNTIFLWKLMRSTAGGSFADLADVTDGNTGNRHPVSSGGCTRRGNGHDTNDQNAIQWNAIDTPNTTSAVTYSPYFKQESSGTNVIYIGHSAGNNSDWGNQSYYQATIMEIKV